MFKGITSRHIEVDGSSSNMGAVLSVNAADAVEFDLPDFSDLGYTGSASSRSVDHTNHALLSSSTTTLLGIIFAILMAVMLRKAVGWVRHSSLGGSASQWRETTHKSHRNSGDRFYSASTERCNQTRKPGQHSLEELKVVFVIRTDLNMGKGKIGAQCGHAAIGNYRRALKSNNPFLEQWLQQGQRKVVLKGPTEDDMLELRETAQSKGINTYVVYDTGRTQVPSGSLTVLALGPGKQLEISRFL